MPRLWRNVLVVTVLGVGVFAALSIYADLDKLGDRLEEVGTGAVALALFLAFMNYALRWVRWQAYLRRTGHAVPIRTSLRIFVSGFAMSVTPGKVGELFKAALLRDAASSSMARTVPIVVAERVTDLISLVLIGLVGVLLYGVARAMVIAGTVAMALGMVVIAYRPFALGVIRALEWARIPATARLRELYDNLVDLVRPGPLIWGTFLGMVAWLCECVGFAVIVASIPGAAVPFGLAALVYAATTVAGALSFLPGGLVVTEASMVVLLVRAGEGLDQSAAVAATILIRLCTLWFAVALGLLVLAAARRASMLRA